MREVQSRDCDACGRSGERPARWLRRAEVSWAAPELDEAQRAVVAHRGGPLLVLGGPGTGKTTTVVETAVAQLAAGGRPPLVLTFSRQSVLDLRTRIVGRMGRSSVTPPVYTMHGFCFALLRRFAEPGAEPLRLLTAPEQEFRVRETLAVDEPGMGVAWPDTVHAALPTRGFAAELRQVVARARQLGMDGADLAEVGGRAGRPEWVSAGAFMDEYLELLDFEGAIDYAELVHRARILLTDPAVVEEVGADFSGVIVDEFADHDPAQIGLLRQLHRPDRTFIAVGDPDQSVFGFRGADPRAILSFCREFPAVDGPAPVIVLPQTYRLGRRLGASAARIVDRLSLPHPVPGVGGAAYRAPDPAPGLPTGRIEAYLCDSPGTEAEHIADVLRQAHLHDGVAWADMAVLVRSGRRTLPVLSRALTAAGVPVEVAGDEIALSAELAVRPLLLALEVISTGEEVGADAIAALLTSPLGGLDSLDMRRLGRDLRRAERELTGPIGLPPADELIRRVVLDPEIAEDWIECLGAEPPTLARARALGGLLARARGLVADGAHAEEVLWSLWRGTPWPDDLRNAALNRGRLDGADRANRDLDAVVALFEVARRSAEQPGRRGVAAFLAEVSEQQIPADTQREASVRGRGVRLMTAHRAKGREWDLVVVASVQEGLWPDLRTQGSLLEADRLGVEDGHGEPVFGLAPPAEVGTRLAEERRLFHVAITRARRRLVVTAVSGTEGEADQPSRFLDELGVDIAEIHGRPRRPLTLGALVAELRRTATDPEADPGLREAAAVRLARLADAVDDAGHPLVPGADPARWWGTAPITVASQRMTADDEPVPISPSTLGALLTCPRQWFLSRRASGEAGRSSAANSGQVMHTLLEHAEQLSTDDLLDHLDQVWDRLSFDAHYLSAIERAETEAVLGRFVRWREQRTGTLIGTEVGFDIGLVVDGRPIRLHGTVDRLEQEPDGRLRIVDFKTGRRALDKREVPGNEQLGVYQLAVTSGAFDELTGGERRVAGAELVYLRVADDRTDWPTVLQQESLDRQAHLPETDADPDAPALAYPTWVHEKLSRAADTVRNERFHATPGSACRFCAFTSSCPALGSEVVR